MRTPLRSDCVILYASRTSVLKGSQDPQRATVWRRYPDEPKPRAAIVTELSISRQSVIRVIGVSSQLSSVPSEFSAVRFPGSLRLFSAHTQAQCMCACAMLAPAVRNATAARHRPQRDRQPGPYPCRVAFYDIRPGAGEREPARSLCACNACDACCTTETAAGVSRHRAAAEAWRTAVLRLLRTIRHARNELPKPTPKTPPTHARSRHSR